MKAIISVFLVLNLTLVIGQNSTYKYDDLIESYKSLATNNEDIHLFNMGQSDYGKPIYLCALGVVADSAKVFAFARNTTNILINNAIHPGEPCGVNASLDFVNAYSKMSTDEKLNYPLIAIIPAYNVGGMHNRGAFSRANQEGPEEYGFRGNSRNLDLNRDFMKMDSENMKTFAKIFHLLDPDVFLDTHTSNGADYQYTMTIIASMKARLNNLQASLIYDEMIPLLSDSLMAIDSLELFPYIEMAGNRLDKGMVAFNDKARYSMGYARLFNTISFTSETHMLKSFEQRVRATYNLIDELALLTLSLDEEIERVKTIVRYEDEQKDYFKYNYALDTAMNAGLKVNLKGYAYRDISSKITEQPRLFYDRSRDTVLNIPYHFHYSTKDSLFIPKFYVVRRYETDLLSKLRWNYVEMEVLEQDTIVTIRQAKIMNFETVNYPYEGHYLHYNTKANYAVEELRLQKGDVLVYTNQKARNFIVEFLEPNCADSYFNWGFMDAYLQQKEYFSPYVFEDIAVEILNKDADLKYIFEEKKSLNKKFRENRFDQLLFIYQHSKYYEETHKVLPIYKSLN